MRDPLIVIILFIVAFSTASFAGNRLRETSLNDGLGIGLGITMLAIAIYMAMIDAFVFFLVVSVIAFLMGRLGIQIDGSSSSSSSSSGQEYRTEEPRHREPSAAVQETVRTEPTNSSASQSTSYNHSKVIDANTVYSYWAFVKTGTGSFIKVTVQAPNSYIAEQMLKNTYGGNLMTGAAMIPE